MFWMELIADKTGNTQIELVPRQRVLYIFVYLFVYEKYRENKKGRKECMMTGRRRQPSTKDINRPEVFIMLGGVNRDTADRGGFYTLQVKQKDW
jgi:hypothetical protein